MSAASFKVNIYSPDKKIGEYRATLLVCPAVDGELGVMANHAPMLSVLKEGTTRITDEKGEVIKLRTQSGLLTVKDNVADIIYY